MGVIDPGCLDLADLLMFTAFSHMTFMGSRSPFFLPFSMGGKAEDLRTFEVIVIFSIYLLKE